MLPVTFRFIFIIKLAYGLAILETILQLIKLCFSKLLFSSEFSLTSFCLQNSSFSLSYKSKFHPVKGYWKCSTRARVISQTLEHWNGKIEIRQKQRKNVRREE